MSIVRLFAIVCVAACSSVATAWTQVQTPSAAATLTVASAVDEAIQHNLNLMAERANLSIADAAAITAKLRPNPVVSVSADHLDWLGTGFDDVNNGGPPEFAWRVDVPLERGHKRDARLEVASGVRAEADARFADAVRQLTQDVTLACVDVLAARTMRSLVADSLRSFEDLVRVNETRASAGAIAPFESTRSAVAMLQFRSTAVRADLALSTALARLRALLGRAPDAPVELSGELGDLRADPVPELSALQQMAVDTRPDLRELAAAQARTVADLRLQEALGKIDYTLGAEYRRQQGNAGRSNSLGLFVSAPLPVFNRNQGEVARADAARLQTTEQVTARRAEIAADVASAYQEFVVNRELAASIERDLLKPATSARDISAYTYKAGGSTLIELLDAQRAFNETMESYVESLANLRRAASHLNAAVGTEVVK